MKKSLAGILTSPPSEEKPPKNTLKILKGDKLLMVTIGLNLQILTLKEIWDIGKIHRSPKGFLWYQML